MKFYREPLFHFLLIGAAIYALYGAFAEPAAEENGDTIVVSAGEVRWMHTSWLKRWNRPPTERELDGLIEQYIRETVLYREAVAMGLDQQDQVIRRRLAQKLEFLAKDLVALTPPTDEKLKEYFAKHRKRYQAPVRYTFTQVFLDPDKRGDSTVADAEKIKAELIAEGDAIEDPGALGDGLMLQSYYPNKDAVEIQKNFGGGFMKSLAELSPGQWHGPILSGYGVHLVFVSHVHEPPAPVFADVRERVEQDWRSDRSEELNEEFYVNLRDRYAVVVDLPASDELLPLTKEPAR